MALKKHISVLPLRLAHFALFRLVFVCVSVVQRRQQQQGFLSSWPFLHHAHCEIAPSHARAIMRKKRGNTFGGRRSFGWVVDHLTIDRLANGAVQSYTSVDL